MFSTSIRSMSCSSLGHLLSFSNLCLFCAKYIDFAHTITAFILMQGAVYTMKFNPQGTAIASGSHDKDICELFSRNL